MIILLLGVIAGFLFGLAAAPVWEIIQKWRKKRRKFTCDICKKRKRLHEGSSSLALDLAYGDELVPLNLRVCKRCVPSA